MQDEIILRIRNEVNVAILQCLDSPVILHGDQSLIDDLGFDSMRIAALAICLEEKLNSPVLLNDWLGMAASTSALTISSLNEYVIKQSSRDVNSDD